MLIGLIADTHGLVRPGVHGALAGVDLILHAGDIGGDDILAELGLIAPVRAVLGNTDPPTLPGAARAIETTYDGVRIHVSHGHEIGVPAADALLATYDADVIVYGHTHRQLVYRAPDSRLVINPGAAGAQRYDLPPSVARLSIHDGRADAELVVLAT
jgi:hypothetical protein